MAGACATLLVMEGCRDHNAAGPDAAPAASVLSSGSAGHGDFHDPVFVLAPARSYTTVSVALLAGHPQLYGLPETSLFVRDTVSEILAMPAVPSTEISGRRHTLTGLERALAQLHDGRQDQTALDRAIDWI